MCSATGKPLFPKIKVLDQEGAVAFNAMDTDERWHASTPPGEYVATAWIPGNFLNEGSAIVEAAICSIDFPKLEHHAAVYEAVSFEVLDPGEGDSARGNSPVSGVASSGRCSSGRASGIRTRRDRRSGGSGGSFERRTARYEPKHHRLHVRVAGGTRQRAARTRSAVRPSVRIVVADDGSTAYTEETVERWSGVRGATRPRLAAG